MIKKRFVEILLPNPQSKKIVLLTGARQTGKTTLAKAKYSNLPYIRTGWNACSVKYS